ncbi:hypothetical protein RZS08_34700, partial [Arthrospira platensis SPKY1]|nr:hypothetical protein [Arthrospira platensis SPKY1]
MELPKLSVPTKEITIPSSGKTIKIRPFLVREEKLLLMAKESGSLSDISYAMMGVIQSCVGKGVNINHLEYFDLEYILLQLK